MSFNNKETEPFFNLKPPDKIDPSILIAKPYQYIGEKILVEIVNPEFTSLCPMTGLPDFGTVRIRYIPREKIVELKSLKYYFLGYRNQGIFYEHLVNRILQDLYNLLQPEFINVEVAFTPRGGIRTTVTAQRGELPPQFNFKFFRSNPK